MRTAKNLLNKIETWLLPYCCIVCNKLSDQTKDICTNCQHELPWVSHCCIQCGISYEHKKTNNLHCGQCTKNKPSFDFTITAFEYQDQISSLITQFKFKRELTYGRVLAELLATIITQKYIEAPESSTIHTSNTVKSLYNLPEVIVPAPLHWWRQTSRGFNQASIIAKILSKQLSIPINNQLIKRKKLTKPQKSLKLKQRKQNVHGAFALKKKLDYQHIALVDDVMTTGNTVNSIAKLLKQHGVKTVTVWALARTN